MPFGVEKSGKKFKVVTKAGPHKGKVHGTHTSKADATAQLRAIYANWDGKESEKPKEGDLEVVEMCESMNESNELIMKLHYEKKIDLSALEAFWKEAISRQENYGKGPDDRDKNNPKFWKGVKECFQKLVDSVDIQEAKEIIMNRDQYKETADSYLDALQNDDYVKAKEVFPQLVDTKIKAMINNRGKEFLKSLSDKSKESVKKQ